MRWLGLVVGSLLALAALPASARDKSPPVFQQCIVRHSLTIGSVALTRMTGAASSADFVKLSIPGVSILNDNTATLQIDARYDGHSTVADVQASKVVISAEIRKPFERREFKESYKLRLYGPAGQTDFPLTAKKDVIELTLPLAEFEARFGAGNVLDIGIVVTYGDGSSGERSTNRFDLRALRTRVAIAGSQRAALDALPPGLDTSCTTANTNEVVTFAYACSRSWTDAQGTFIVGASHVEWKGPAAPGVDARLFSDGDRPGKGKLFALSLSLSAEGDKSYQLRSRLWIAGREADTSGGRIDLSETMAGTAPVWAVFEKAGMPDRRVDLSPTLFRDVVGKLLAVREAVVQDELAPVGRCSVSRSVDDPTVPKDIVI